MQLELNTLRQRLQEKSKQSRVSVKALSSTVKDLTQQLEQEKSDHAEAEQSTRQNILDELDAERLRRQEAEGAFEDLTIDYANAQERISELSRTINRLRDRYQGAEEDNTHLEDRVQDLQQCIQILNQTVISNCSQRYCGKERRRRVLEDFLISD